MHNRAERGWESDRSIVAKKRGNARGAKGPERKHGWVRGREFRLDLRVSLQNSGLRLARATGANFLSGDPGWPMGEAEVRLDVGPAARVFARAGCGKSARPVRRGESGSGFGLAFSPIQLYFVVSLWPCPASSS